MHHCHIQLIDDPQWVSYCVENGCSFRDHIQGYVCRTHCSRHLCSVSSCSLIKNMVAHTHRGPSESPCPVADLLLFHKPQLEFRGPCDIPERGASIQTGYGAMEYEPGPSLRHWEMDSNDPVLKASIALALALFSTMLTPDFCRQYEIIDRSQGSNISTTNGMSVLWMAKVFELAELIQSNPEPELHCSREMSSVVKEAVLKNTVAISTLFDSRDRNIARFMKKVTCKYNHKHTKGAEFYTMIIMLTLCLFPHLRHRVLDSLFNNRTLVLMCFDKTRTRHSQWSTLSTHIHLHVNRREFQKRVLTNRDLYSFLPVVLAVTLDNYIASASYMEEVDSMPLGQTTRDHGEDLPYDPETPPYEDKDCTPLLDRTTRDHTENHGEDLPCDPDTQLDSSQSLKKKKTKNTKNTKTRKTILGKRKRPCTPCHYEMHEGRLEEKEMCI